MKAASLLLACLAPVVIGEDLFEAAENGDRETIEAFLSNADVNAKDTSGLASMHYAAGKGNLEVAIELLDRNADVNVISSQLETPLHLASWNGHSDVAEMLLERGASVNAANRFSKTPLHHAVERNHLELVKILLRYGAKKNAQDCGGRWRLNSGAGDVAVSDNWAPLHCAVKNGNVDIVNELLKFPSAILNIKTSTGTTPLHLVVEYDHPEVAKTLICHGADITTKDEWGETALHYAAAYGRLEIVKTFLSGGANPNVANEKGYTPLRLAVQNGHLDVVKALIDNGSDQSGDEELQDAIGTNYTCLEMVKILLAGNAHLRTSSADAIAKVKLGETAFHYAAACGRLEIVKTFLSGGANPNVANEKGYTPLRLAVQNGHLDVVKALMDNGSDQSGDKELQDAIGTNYTCLKMVEILLGGNAGLRASKTRLGALLCLASKHKRLEVAKLLLGSGANPNVRDQSEGSRRTPLHYAVRGGTLGIVKLLLDSGADPNVRDRGEHKMTPLHYAIEWGSLSGPFELKGLVMVNMLLEESARVDARDSRGRTSLHYAVKAESLSAVKVLLSRGANVNAKTNDGQTPLDYAIRRRRMEIAKMLLKYGAGQSFISSIMMATIFVTN